VTTFDVRHSAPVPSVGRRTADTVLVLRALGLGDALTGLPALRGARRLYPDRFLTMAVGPEIGGWLKGLGLIDEVLPNDRLADLEWPPSGWIGVGGHVAIDLHGRGPLSHRILAATAPDELIAFRCRRAGHLAGPRWQQEEHEVQRWCRLIRSAGGSCDAEDLRLPRSGDRTDSVVVHPGAASASRRWPEDRWGLLAGRIARSGRRIIVTGGPGEVELCTRVVEIASAAGGAGAADMQVEAGTLDLPALTTVIGGSALLVSGDTGVAHLATALSTPSVLLFGPTAPQYWGPAIDSTRHTVLWHGSVDEPGNPHGDVIDPALASITASEVIEAVSDLLAVVMPEVPDSW
jgi:ADP-heptose:LPS heptosyltransferase